MLHVNFTDIQFGTHKKKEQKNRKANLLKHKPCRWYFLYTYYTVCYTALWLSNKISVATFVCVFVWFYAELWEYEGIKSIYSPRSSLNNRYVWFTQFWRFCLTCGCTNICHCSVPKWLSTLNDYAMTIYFRGFIFISPQHRSAPSLTLSFSLSLAFLFFHSTFFRIENYSAAADH